VFDHLSVGVADLARSAVFTGEAPFGILSGGPDARPPGPGFHLAFAAPSREAVDRFHAAALSTGGVDEGGPGIRENYDPGYYAAFVRDPDGHRLEAVLHERTAG
jgi:catechol 2,3-dioxygenase-like lactoylglutathione lyase family enzyme